ncbi:small RNA degrading nuclease 5 [Micractinium conductrix]|uniref:Small RNA degrading nuclease 5 n=1 Tax=Micractinium conductrix TaxID=554055 RepID=A0A2P6V7S5_9CHLO|nr:small RNA degrading nuclease 5 [Micractinium conductrix]|eukprot:PSC70139.1 small RNA degrading nuclease 5 [Micractinium conductrix]
MSAEPAEESELEEGELAEVAPAHEQAVTPHHDPQEPHEQLLAARPDGRAPYYAGPDSDGFRGGRSGKKKKRKTGAAAAAAAGFVNVYGQGATAEVEVFPEAGPIRTADVQNLVLWVLGSQGTNPRWCFVKNKPLVQRVLLVVAHGLDSTTWSQAGAAGALPAWRRLLGEPVELQARNATLAPGATVHSLLTVPQTKKRRREDSQAAGAAQQAAGEEPPPAPLQPLAAANGAANGAAAAAAAAAAEGEGDGEAGRPAGAKRMKLGAADDVSTRVAPQLPAAVPAAAAAAAEQPSTADPAGEVTAAAAAAAGGEGAADAGRRCWPLPPEHYVLTLEQLQEHGYPLPRLDEASGEMVCPEGFVATQACKGTPQHDLVALDCEMCITEAGFELTRATLVDQEGKVLYDELVVPHNPITDHNTRYSGITAEMLQGVTTRLEDVQAALQRLVSAETLLVAHSGDNDLQALKLIHANVIDTSVLFPHPRGPPYKSALRVLASRHLLRTIQQGEHNPVEDARAAMDLALLKFERGPLYGAGTAERGDKLVEVLSDGGRRSAMVDKVEVLNRHVAGNCSGIPADSDAVAMPALCRELARLQVHFIWGQLSALQQFYEERLTVARESGEAEPSAAYRQGGAASPAGAAQPQLQQQQEQHPADAGGGGTPEQQQRDGQAPGSDAAQQQEQQGGGDGEAGQPPAAGSPNWPARQAAALASLDASLQQLWDAAPPGTLLVVVTGQGDTSYSRYLQEHKWRRQQGLGGLQAWSPECEAHLAAVQDRALSALCFAAVKRVPGAATAAQQQQQQQQGKQQG